MYFFLSINRPLLDNEHVGQDGALGLGQYGPIYYALCLSAITIFCSCQVCDNTKCLTKYGVLNIIAC